METSSFSIMKGMNNMFEFLQGKKTVDVHTAAKILKTKPELLKEFEAAYAASNIAGEVSDNFFDINAKQMSEMMPKEMEMTEDVEAMIAQIVEELVADTPIWRYDGKQIHHVRAALPEGERKEITAQDVNALAEPLRPQLTANLMKRDIVQPSYLELLEVWNNHKTCRNPRNKERWYHMFRQGLDILDLDAITYEIIGQNQNSMGYWLPRIVDAVDSQGFFKIPKTTIIKVPLTMLQLTRCDYMQLTPTTLAIVDQFCQRVFDLKEDEEYFIKTGTYSSKYDFRNAHVKGAKEVRELGEYLLFIHFQALQMASPLSQPVIYGVSTTNEWVVREFIQDKENNPCIYNGMPLHTEYRVFVDFDTKEVLGVNPYWDPKIMKDRFSKGSDASQNKMKHDYVVYSMHEQKLMERYNQNVKNIVDKIEHLIHDIDLPGQWSVDIMQNGDDFYLIDMASAADSALNHCVPKEKLHKLPENWIPELTMKELPWSEETK